LQALEQAIIFQTQQIKQKKQSADVHKHNKSGTGNIDPLTDYTGL